MSEGASRCLGSAVCYRGRGTNASKDVLPAQHNIGQGLGSARVVPVACEGDILQGSAQTTKKTGQTARSVMGTRQCKGHYSTDHSGLHTPGLGTG